MPGTDHIAQIADVSIKWKVSMAVSSNEVKNLNEPMITLMLVTTHENGNKINRPIEMTLAKFRELFETLKQVHQQMENTKLI